MSEPATFRINIKTGEIEISGSEEFVNSKIDSLGDVLDLIQDSVSNHNDGDTTELVAPSSSSEIDSAEVKLGNLPETFGEWMHSFKSDLSEVDKALITARYVQDQSADNDFKTAEVNKALKDHGIKLSNPSTFLKQLEKRKYLFQTRKVGSLSYKRVSVDGQNYLETLKRED